MKEHSILSMLVSKPTSVARSEGFNKQSVNEFNEYEKVGEGR